MKWGNGRFLPKKRKRKLAKQKISITTSKFVLKFSFKKGKKNGGGDDNMRTKQKYTIHLSTYVGPDGGLTTGLTAMKHLF